MVPQSILWRTPPKGGAYAASVSLLTAFRKAGFSEEGGLLPLISSSQDATSTQRMPLSAVTPQPALKNIAEALPEGRSQHLGGVAEKPSEAYPSFSLDGEPSTILSYSGFSDVGKAFVIG